MITKPRIPYNCPEGFKGRYTVMQGDTMFNISQMFRVRLETLAQINRHIPNSNILNPGDVLCVPAFVSIPCCVQMQAKIKVPFGSYAYFMTGFAPQGSESVMVTATLPKPSYFGSYDIYISTVVFPDIGGFGNELTPTPIETPVWSTRIEFPTVLFLTDSTEVIIQPSNSRTGEIGPIIFANKVNCKCNGG